MIRRQHQEHDFFDEANSLREVLDARFTDAYTDSIAWYYFCDPRMYTYLRASPQKVFPKDLFDRFMKRLREWCIENLGLTPMHLPYLHLMVNGCRLGLHSDFHNGAWGYVYSLTRWDQRRFTGGETLLLRDGIPSYKKHHVHGEVLYELVPAQFNQLLVFDDRIVHATPAIEGSMDPMDGRIAMVGHIRATSPFVRGSLSSMEVRRVVLGVLPQIRDSIRSYKDVQGTVSYRLTVDMTGKVESAEVLTDNVVTPFTGYEQSDAVAAVKSIVYQALVGMRFPSARGSSVVIVPILIPLPDLRPIEFSVNHGLSSESAAEWITANLEGDSKMGLHGHWQGDTFQVQEPLAGSIRVGPHQLLFSFDPPMWVPSQRESFHASLRGLVERAS
ncbi:hypothetical protein JM946_29365 [Steroidobacter sp. S1-65]|uniref:Prolyl 4-hydroxylase alpha subunit Fe(2+) 2OG dioxygenase domain-containing protein n=1 Tax=Steroidobacter gossypii TaxID=2805490 RepID=A0ABS1X6L1_9GAMM|nr:hypothetical protein [Steroidobacter gossypii]MBM0108861.1 hypothetical protein [Steroidobacter gossypii]